MSAAPSADGRPRIVVGYDGSETAQDAVAYAAERAGRRGKLYVVHCFDPPPDWYGTANYERMREDHQGRGKAVLDELEFKAGNALMDVDYEVELVGGYPAKAIAALAAEHDADEIVVGSRGFGRLRSALGSVSHELLHIADRPVVVIPFRWTQTHGGIQS